MSVLQQFEDLQRRAESLAAEVVEHRRIAEYLRDSETRYRHLFDANPLPMWVYDLDSLKFLAVNDAAVEHYGYSRQQFLAMSIADIRPDSEVLAVQEIARKGQAGLTHAGI